MNSSREKIAFWTTLPCLIFLGLSPLTTAAVAYRPLDVGTEVSYFDYEEPGVKDTGVLYGVYGAYTLQSHRQTKVGAPQGLFEHIKDNGMLRLDGNASYGKIDYRSDASGSLNGQKDYTIEVRLTGGYTFNLSARLSLTPYLGAGYRYLNDDSSGQRTSTGYYGYERESNYVYIPLGFETKSPLAGMWTWGLAAEYDFFIKGEQVSHLEDVSSQYGTFNNKQNSGYGARGSVDFVRHGGPFDILIEPFIRYWKIAKSNIDVNCNAIFCLAGFEPRNHTLQYGLKLGVKF